MTRINQAKISLIKTLIPQTTIKGIKIFLGHAGFYKKPSQIFQKLQHHYVDCLRMMQSLKLMKHASLHLRKSKLNFSYLPSLLHQTTAKNLKLCVMPVTMRWQLFWGKEKRRYLEPSIMPIRPSMKLKKIIQQLRRIDNGLCL